MSDDHPSPAPPEGPPPDAASDSRRLTAAGRAQVIAEAVGGSLHDLNNSLQVIGGVTELLLGRLDLPDTVIEKLERIESHAARASATSLCLQRLGRSSAEAPGAIDLAQLVRATLALRQYRLSKDGIASRIDAPAGDPCRVRAVASRLQHALLAVLLNAEQATAGRTDPEVAIELERREDRLVVCVRDNGPGMPLELHERAFEAWFTTRDEAAGLGLWLARASVTPFGGTVWIDRASADGAGAIVRLELPAAP